MIHGIRITCWSVLDTLFTAFAYPYITIYLYRKILCVYLSVMDIIF
jgi:hypothetical protein